ncbi:MAG TPA: selenocysteine-specific translation elongation factor [Chthoniobacterales bacterium]
MIVRHYVIATAGHIDHGKSALVKALTGTDPDRLPEEKQRGITIDLGFAELPLTAADGRQFSLGIIDVPGHEDFVRNMIAGVGSINLGLLIVAADDGWMPQTEEHFQILSYLGVPRLVVAITKCDIGDGAAVASQVRKQLAESPVANAPIVQTSANSGAGLTDLRTALVETVAAAPLPPDYGKPRLPIDRVFTLHGIGTIVTGTLIGGSVNARDTACLQPAGIDVRVRSVQSHGRDVPVAHPGTRTALNLPEIESGNSPRAAKRGDMIVGTSISPVQTIDVLLRVSGRRPPGIPVIKTNTVLDVHHGTARVRAMVRLLDQAALGAGESRLAQLRLERPILAFYQDRFVVRDTAQKQTLAGGIVLDPDASRRRDRKEQQLRFLQTRAQCPESIETAILTQLERDRFIATANLLQKSPFKAEQISEVLRRLAAEQKLTLAGSLAADVSAWRALRDRAIKLIDQGHAESPQTSGLNLSILRSKLRGYSAGIINAVVADLVACDFIRRDETIARRSHQAELPASLDAASAEILRQLSEKPFDPPTAKAVTPNQDAHKAMRFLIASGRVIQLDANLVLAAAAFEKMKGVIVSFLGKKAGGASASEIRQELQTSRRILIPLLEYLDRKNVTRRKGDLRILAH